MFLISSTFPASLASKESLTRRVPLLACQQCGPRRLGWHALKSPAEGRGPRHLQPFVRFVLSWLIPFRYRAAAILDK